MSAVKKTYKNLVWLGTSELAARIMQFILMIYAARLLDQESFGKFSLALSISFMAIIFSDFGINTLLIKEIASDGKKAGTFFSSAFVLKMAFSVAVFILAVIFAHLYGYSSSTKQVIYIVLFFAALSSFTDQFYSLFRAYEKMEYDSVIKISRMILLLSAGIYALKAYKSVIVFSLVFVCVEIIMILIAYCFAKSRFSLRWKFDFGSVKDTARKSAPFGLAFIFGSIYFYISPIIISKFKGELDVAVFSAAYNLAIAVLFIPTVYINAVFPLMSRLFSSKNSGLIVLYEKSFKYLYMIGLPIAAGTFVLADRLILAFYGESYRGSALVLKILSIFVLFKFVNFVTGYTLSSSDKQKKRTYSQAIAAIGSILLNIALIPKYGIAGAAFAILITEIVLFILYFKNVSSSIHRISFGSIALRPLIAAACMIGFVNFATIELIVLVPIAGVVYFAALFLMRAFDDKDKEIFSRITH